jgi:hypothetical protein
MLPKAALSSDCSRLRRCQPHTPNYSITPSRLIPCAGPSPPNARPILPPPRTTRTTDLSQPPSCSFPSGRCRIPALLRLIPSVPYTTLDTQDAGPVWHRHGEAKVFRGIDRRPLGSLPQGSAEKNDRRCEKTLERLPEGGSLVCRCDRAGGTCLHATEGHAARQLPAAPGFEPARRGQSETREDLPLSPADPVDRSRFAGWVGSNRGIPRSHRATRLHGRAACYPSRA